MKALTRGDRKDKTSQKVTIDKDSKCVDAGRKGRENFMKKVKENILNDAKKGGGDTTNSSNETTSPTTGVTSSSSNKTSSVTNTATIRSNDAYVYGVGILAVLAIGVCVFFTTLLRLKIKKLSMKNKINHQNDVICFKKIYNK